MKTTFVSNYSARGAVSLRKLLLWLATSVLLMSVSPGSFASYQPQHLACAGEPFQKPPDIGGCRGIWIVSPLTGFRLESFIGYVSISEEPGTVRAYLTCNVKPPNPRLPAQPPQCDGRWYVSFAPNSQFDRVIGYVHLDPVSGTSARYVACYPNWFPPRAPPTCSNRWYVTEDPFAFMASFIGYVHVDQPTTTQTVSPKFFVGSVNYLPPGRGPSRIIYGLGSVVGNTLKTSDSFTVTDKFRLGIGDNFGISFGSSFGGASENSTDMEIRQTANRDYTGTGADEINHDYDQIVLFFGVQVHATYNHYLNQVSWDIDFSQTGSQEIPASGYPVPVGCLRPNSTLTPETCAQYIEDLTERGLTPEDFAEILKVHPFADPNASATPDPARYVWIDSVAYVPSPTPITYTYNVTNSSTKTNSETCSVSLSVGIDATNPKPKIFKYERSMTFTHSSTSSNRTGSSISSTWVVSMPSVSYYGPTTLNVYIDTIFKTFMFSFQ